MRPHSAPLFARRLHQCQPFDKQHRKDARHQVQNNAAKKSQAGNPENLRKAADEAPGLHRRRSLPELHVISATIRKQPLAHAAVAGVAFRFSSFLSSIWIPFFSGFTCCLAALSIWLSSYGKNCADGLRFSSQHDAR